MWAVGKMNLATTRQTQTWIEKEFAHLVPSNNRQYITGLQEGLNTSSNFFEQFHASLVKFRPVDLKDGGTLAAGLGQDLRGKRGK
jgi:hypothetical protein